MNLTVDRQGCVIKTVAVRLRTDGHTDTQTDTGTDKSLKTEGPKILSNDIFYFKTDHWRSNIIGDIVLFYLHGKIFIKVRSYTVLSFPG